jgi:MoaA/NifB/PqqE/SkfB family radical SAM enzyme
LTCLTGKPFLKPTSAGIVVTNKYINLIDFLADWGVKQITFTGGEPLLYKDLVVLLKHANKQNITTGFSTNGTITNDKKTSKRCPKRFWCIPDST